MRPAFPASDYYEGSAPPRGQQPTASLPTTGSPRMVPTFIADRSTGAAPSFPPAASPRVRRRPSSWPPHRPIHSGFRVTHPNLGTDVRCRPTQIRPVRVGSTLTELHALVPLVHLLVSLAEPAPSGSADASRLCQDRFRPHRRSPDQAVLSFGRLLRQPTGKVFHLTRIHRASWRTNRSSNRR